MLLPIFPVPFCIWYTKVLLASVNKLLSQLLLEERILSVDVACFSHIVPVFDLIFLCFQEPIEMILQSALLFTAKNKQLWLWFCFIETFL